VRLRLALCFSLLILLSVALHAAETKVLTNHLGYDPAGPKHAVVLGKESDSVSACALKNYAGDQTALTIPARAERIIDSRCDRRGSHRVSPFSA